MTGEDLKQWCKDNGLSQKELAEHLSVAVNTVSRWVQGTRAIPPYLPLALDQVRSKLKPKKK